MNEPRRTWKHTAWDHGIKLVAKLARSSFHGPTRWLTRGLGVFTLRVQGGRRQHDVPSVAKEWQRMFPNPAMVPIDSVDDRTAHARIHANCPLRGTGDVAACHRMMEYDRRMLERIGGQLVVLHSQAEPGRTHCEVAIRRVGDDLDGLTAAHERA